jgi:elongation factor G
VPRIALVNKLDREGADFFGTVAQIRERLGAVPLVLQVPLGLGPPHVKNPFRGLVDLVEMQLLTFPPKEEALAGGAALQPVATAAIPPEIAATVQEWREHLVATLFDFSDEVAELALAEAPIPVELMRRVIREATIARRVVPVLGGSALDCIGVTPVLDAVAWYLPSPADVPPVEGLDPSQKTPTTIVRGPDPAGPFCGLVFKIVGDKHGDLHYVRVYSGTLKAGSRAWNPLRQKKENIAQLWHLQADHRSPREHHGRHALRRFRADRARADPVSGDRDLDGDRTGDQPRAEEARRSARDDEAAGSDVSRERERGDRANADFRDG